MWWQIFALITQQEKTKILNSRGYTSIIWALYLQSSIILSKIPCFHGWARKHNTLFYEHNPTDPRQERQHHSTQFNGAPCKCKAECFSRVKPELRYHVLESFNSPADKCQQDQHLNGLVVGDDPTWVGTQGCTGKFSEINKGRKKVTYKYFIPTGKLNL